MKGRLRVIFSVGEHFSRIIGKFIEIRDWDKMMPLLFVGRSLIHPDSISHRSGYIAASRSRSLALPYLAPPAAVIAGTAAAVRRALKVIRSGIIAPGEAEQFPLRAGEPTLRGDAAEPMRQLAVMLAGVS
jgi:hypothetical protein